jgi:CO/xanthine dehydrogenase Mo-binding subunit
VQLSADGNAIVRCATHDLGTGAYTAFTQISADALGVTIEKVKFELGNSDYPMGVAGVESTATVGSAIFDKRRGAPKLAKLASRTRSRHFSNWTRRRSQCSIQAAHCAIGEKIGRSATS